MTNDQQTPGILDDLLDQTIQAFMHLDRNNLESLERQASALIASRIHCSQNDLNSIRAKQRLLGSLLHNCEMNLSVLSRLHARNTRDSWAH